jgi:ubiquinone biosynthesis protein UbiJ
VKTSHQWRIDVQRRLAENVAEYLTHERDAFATEEELDLLRRDNQTLRDDVARLEARLLHLQAKAPT